MGCGELLVLTSHFTQWRERQNGWIRLSKVIKEIILSDNKITPQERQSLELALHNNKFDKEAYELLSELLVRTDLNTVNK